MRISQKGKLMKYKKSNIITVMLILTISLIVISSNGCSEDSVTTGTGSDNLELSVFSSNESIGSGSILILDTVKILISDIKLNVSNNNEDSLNFKTGPFVLYLDLFSNVTFISSAIVSSGTYDKISFKVHKLNNNETVSDPEFSDPNGNYSVIVKGSYNGVRFVYRSTKSAHQKITFPLNLDLESSGRSNLTLFVRPYLWFYGSNNVFLDPLDPSNSNEIDNNIKDNINNNFRCFVDNDKNGLPG